VADQETIASVSVVVADGSGASRKRVVRMLAKQTGLKVVAEAGDGPSAIKIAGELRPDVILIDDALNGIAMEKIVGKIIEHSFDTKTILLAESRDTKEIVKALKDGMVGYVLKGFNSLELASAISTVMRGRVYISSLRGNHFDPNGGGKHPHPDERLLARLSSTELQILQMLVQGHSPESIAEMMEIGEHTVVYHRANMMTKFDLHSTPELIDFAIGAGITQIDEV